jgi:hypothetical protein
MNARTQHIIKEEVTRIQNHLAAINIPNFKMRAVTVVTRRFLLEGPYTYNGRMRIPKAKSIGAGVYEIWLEDSDG